MTDEDALLAAIIANPDEDTPRLAYADWLDENGKPERAELIRVQIELTRKPAGRRRTARHRELLTRLYELLETHSVKWRYGFILQSSQTIFRRGFVEDVQIAPEELPAITPAALRAHSIRTLWIQERHLTLDEERSTEVFERVAAWPGFPRLHTLRASQLEVTAAGIAALTATPDVANLRVLDLSDCWVDDRAIVALAEAANLSALEELRFASVPLRAPGALSLAFSSRLVNLRRLRILCSHPEDVQIDDSLRLAVTELRSRFGAEVRVMWE